MIALLGGHVDIMSSFPTNTTPQMKAGKIIPLATSGPQRDPDFPNVPTLKETGLDIEVVIWKGILAPAATPRPIVDKLGGACKKMLENKNSIEAIRKLGDYYHYAGPDELNKFWRAEYEAHKELGKAFKSKS
jgi:tripartite-type tricarboxylate transporter receptor subunit TctC